MDAEKRELIEENRRLRARVEELERTVRVLQEQVQVLAAALEEARRAGKRQAAPFRKGKIVQKPKQPGRKAGKDQQDFLLVKIVIGSHTFLLSGILGIFCNSLLYSGDRKTCRPFIRYLT